MSAASCSVVITVRPQDTAAHAQRCIDALQRQQPTLPAAIFVVGHMRGATSFNSHAIPIYTIERDNVANGRNAALQQATTALVAFTDADCQPTPDWLCEVTRPLLTFPAVVGVKGAFTTESDRLIARFSQVEYAERYARLARLPHIDFIDLYSAAYRRDVVLDNGGFDTRFPLLSSRELSFRLAARGYAMQFAPAAIVQNDHRRHLADYLDGKFKAGYWNAQVVRRFPNHGVQDSHTPQLLKVQIALVGLLLLLLGTVPLAPQLQMVVYLASAGFLLASVPFVAHAWRTDRSTALIAPVMLFLRGLALGGGYAVGLLLPKPNIVGQEATIGGIHYLLKRTMDILGGLVGCAICLLLLPFMAVAIKRDSAGPIFFRQERIGRGGRPFTMIKFRSMVANAEAQLDELVDIDTLAEPMFKLKHDPRVTDFGRIMRRWSLDELPQFWNVLTGEMSLIGPRPEESRLVAKYSAFHRRRLAVKPGLSGPMQVSGRGDLSLDERVHLEIDYIEHYSIWRDVKLILATFPAIFSGDGAR